MLAQACRLQLVHACCYKACAHSWHFRLISSRPAHSLLGHQITWPGNEARGQHRLLHRPHPSHLLRSKTVSMRSHSSAQWGTSGTTDVPLPTDKLSSDLKNDTEQAAVILLNCGSFNPPTIMHLRMLDVAAQVLRKVCCLTLHPILTSYALIICDLTICERTALLTRQVSTVGSCAPLTSIVNCVGKACSTHDKTLKRRKTKSSCAL